VICSPSGYSITDGLVLVSRTAGTDASVGKGTYSLQVRPVYLLLGVRSASRRYSLRVLRPAVTLVTAGRCSPIWDVDKDHRRVNGNIVCRALDADWRLYSDCCFVRFYCTFYYHGVLRMLPLG
jgi:hypothetical protein